MFPSARTHESDIGKRNQGINYRVLVTPHERYWDFSYMCTDFGSITGGRRTSGGTESYLLPRILWASAPTLGAIFQASPGLLTRKSGEKRRRVGNGPGSRYTTQRGRGKAFQTPPCLVSFPTRRPSPAPSHFGKSSAHLGFPCRHPRKVQMKVLVAQPHHVSESSHSPCQRNNYAIKYHLFLFFLNDCLHVCGLSGSSHPPASGHLSLLHCRQYATPL